MQTTTALDVAGAIRKLFRENVTARQYQHDMHKAARLIEDYADQVRHDALKPMMKELISTSVELHKAKYKGGQ
jgi:hypothetical protein